MKTNDWCQIELLVLHSNTWNHLTVCKQMIDINDCKYCKVNGLKYYYLLFAHI